MNILYLGSGAFGLPALRRLSELRPGQVVVGTLPDAAAGRKRRLVPTPVREVALELGLPCHELPSLKREHADPLLADVKPEVSIVCDFRLFLTRRFLAAIPRHCYNLHPSLLPLYRGAAPVARSILSGETEHGITLYQMVREMDAGPIVGQTSLPLTQKRDRVDLEEQLSQMGADLLAENLESLEAGDPPLQPQVESEATFAPIIAKDEGWVDWDAPADQIENHVLAMKPWPRSFARWYAAPGAEPVLLFIDEVSVAAGEHAPMAPGTLAECSDAGLAVACGPGGTDRVLLQRVQRAGKRTLTAAEFLRGSKIEPGHRLACPDAQSEVSNDGAKTPGGTQS